MTLWKKLRDVYLEEDYTKGEARLGIKFDEYNGESQSTSDPIAEVEAVLKDKGVLEESECSCVIDFKKHGSEGLSTAVLRKHTGTAMYLLRDIAHVIDFDKKQSFDKLIYVVSPTKMPTSLALQRPSSSWVQGLSAQLDDAHLFGDMIDQRAAAVKTAMAEQKGAAPAAAAEPFGITSLIAQYMHTERGNGYAFDSKKIRVERVRRAERAKERIREELTFTPALLGRIQSRVNAKVFRRCIFNHTTYQSICNSLKDQNLPERERRPDLG
ncbi:Arginine--tRNA ligase, cytoplasmic [Colletotrichum sp. SAR 10_99]|nr:Arginine--tRNA ligase, cytoplasmic [Colletotrichum sp. SAR 10_99]